VFLEALLDQIVKANEILFYKLPNSKDPDNDWYKMSIDASTASSFTKLQYGTIFVAP
jgi:hypothetical protein